MLSSMPGKTMSQNVVPFPSSPCVSQTMRAWRPWILRNKKSQLAALHPPCPHFSRFKSLLSRTPRAKVGAIRITPSLWPVQSTFTMHFKPALLVTALLATFASATWNRSSSSSSEDHSLSSTTTTSAETETTHTTDTTTIITTTDHTTHSEETKTETSVSTTHTYTSDSSHTHHTHTTFHTETYTTHGTDVAPTSTTTAATGGGGSGNTSESEKPTRTRTGVPSTPTSINAAPGGRAADVGEKVMLGAAVVGLVGGFWMV
jgi:hypothetical protein